MVRAAAQSVRNSRRNSLTLLHPLRRHLGNFWVKDAALLRTRKESIEERRSADEHAFRAWPASHPGMAGFDEWHATEASATSSTINCACDAEWLASGCVSGGGVRRPGSAFKCTNYWSSAPGAAANCLTPKSAMRACVANFTQKIPGDDSSHIVSLFDRFLEKDPQRSQPFLAALWLHAVHRPHAALPEYYFAYNDSSGAPAGDYLGLITQMDAAIGRLRALLRERGVADDTLLWFSSDNGPIPAKDAATAQRSSGGLRGCKGSLFEGGLRVPALIEWPARIRANRVSHAPASALDVMPTLLDLLGTPHPRAHWAADGTSLLPRIDAANGGFRQAGGGADRRDPARPLCFKLGTLAACIDNEYKVLSYERRTRAALKGGCDWVDQDGANPTAVPPPYVVTPPTTPSGSHPGANATAYLLFDLDSDPTESSPANAASPELVRKYTGILRHFVAGLRRSQVNESKCLGPDD